MAAGPTIPSQRTVASIGDLLQSSIGGAVRIETALQDDLWPALVDATQIELVILNRDLPCGRHAADLEWMAYLAGTGDEWLVITGDRRIQKNKAERAAFRQAGLKGFVLASGYQTTPINQQASLLIWRWPDIEGLMQSLQPPFLFEMPMNQQTGFKQLPL